MHTRTRRFCAFPRCGALATSGSHCRVHAARAERLSPLFNVRRWYRTSRWFALRARVLRRQRWCPLCEVDDLQTKTTDCDHIVPHRGDPALFWDETNLQGLCKRHHAQKSGAE